MALVLSVLVFILSLPAWSLLCFIAGIVVVAFDFLWLSVTRLVVRSPSVAASWLLDVMSVDGSTVSLRELSGDSDNVSLLLLSIMGVMSIIGVASVDGNSTSLPELSADGDSISSVTVYWCHVCGW